MAHLAGRCTCGRKIRFPKHATYGDQWTCWTCGTTWTMVEHGGRPLHSARSLPPPPDVPTPTDSPSSVGRLLKWSFWLFLLYLLLRSCG